MKKFLACLLALVMALSLVACGDDTTADDDATGDNTPSWRMPPASVRAPLWRP